MSPDYRLRAVNAELEKENRLMNQSIANCASDLLTASAVNAELLAALKFVRTDPFFIKLGSVTHDVVRAAIAKAKGETT